VPYNWSELANIPIRTNVALVLNVSCRKTNAHQIERELVTLAAAIASQKAGLEFVN